MNDDRLNKLVSNQNDLMAAAHQQHLAMEEQQKKMEELMKVLIDGQETIKAQQMKIDHLQQEIQRGDKVATSKKFAVKPPKPDFFKGKRDALEINAWVDQISRYAQFFGLDPGLELVEFAVFYLSGSARDWWTNQSGQLKARVMTWTDFVFELKTAFYPLDHERAVMDKLEKLHQKGSVAAYVELFEKLRSQVSGVSDDLWKRYFIKGLAQNIQIEAIKFNLDTPDASLSQMYQRLTTLGDALWAQKGGNYRPNDSMDLSVIYKPNGKSYAGSVDKRNGKSHRREELRKCFKCGIPGHLKRECGSKNLNMIKAEQSEQIKKDTKDASDNQESKSDFQ